MQVNQMLKQNQDCAADCRNTDLRQYIRAAEEES